MDSEKLPPLGNALSIDHTDEMAGFGRKKVLEERQKVRVMRHKRRTQFAQKTAEVVDGAEKKITNKPCGGLR